SSPICFRNMRPRSFSASLRASSASTDTPASGNETRARASLKRPWASGGQRAPAAAGTAGAALESGTTHFAGGVAVAATVAEAVAVAVAVAVTAGSGSACGSSGAWLHAIAITDDKMKSGIAQWPGGESRPARCLSTLISEEHANENPLFLAFFAFISARTMQAGFSISKLAHARRLR